MYERVAVDSIFKFTFTTHTVEGGRVSPSSAFEANDLKIRRASDGVVRASAVGVSITTNEGGITGLHAVSIDTSDDDDPGFYADGERYDVILDADETIDGENVVAVIARFKLTVEGGEAGILAAIANVQADVDDIQSRLPAALVGGRMDSHVSEIATDAITASALEAAALTAIAETVALVFSTDDPALRAIADTILRRSMESIEGSSVNEPLTEKSLYGVISALIIGFVKTGNFARYFKSDKTTELFSQALTVDPGAKPVTGVSLV